MTTPSAFQIGQQVGTNFAKTRQAGRDEGAIEQILSKAMESGDPAFLQNSIGQILSQVSPERQAPAIQHLKATMDRIKANKQEGIDKTAASEGGYTYGAPAAVQAQQVKNLQPKAPPGGLTGQPVPPEMSQAINDVITNNPEAKADDLALAFDKAGVARTYSNSYIENRRRQNEQEATNIRDQTKYSKDEKLLHHKESQKYDDDLTKKSKVATAQSETIKDIEKAIKSGNVSPTSISNIFKGFGVVGDKISQAFLNKDEATILASIPQLLDGWKDVFGVRLTDADLALLEDKLPSIGKNPEANKAILGVLKKYSDMTMLRSKIARNIKKEYNNLRPIGYADMIEEKFTEMTKPIKIVYTRNGQEREIEIPAYKLPAALEGGAKLANEFEGQQL